MPSISARFERSSSIYCGATDRRSGARLATLAAILALAGFLVNSEVAAGKRDTSFEDVDLTNFSLGAEYARWMVGPIARIATAAERDEFLSLADDAAAVAFIDEFWERRGGEGAWPRIGPKKVYEVRAEEADLFYSEGLYVGRTTDRGTIYVLYGPPLETDWQVSPEAGGPAVEVWMYPKNAEQGLDGSRPERVYYFRTDGDVTRFYTPRRRPQRGRAFGRGS